MKLKIGSIFLILMGHNPIKDREAILPRIVERMSDLKNVFQCHNDSKHGYYSFAPGPGYLDWDSQLDLFRKYKEVDTIV